MIESLVRMTIEDNAGNRDTIQRWINQWYPSAARAVSAVASILEEAPEQTGTPPAPACRRGDRLLLSRLPSIDEPGTCFVSRSRPLLLILPPLALGSVEFDD
jgi:hypothetical protein